MNVLSYRPVSIVGSTIVAPLLRYDPASSPALIPARCRYAFAITFHLNAGRLLITSPLGPSAFLGEVNVGPAKRMKYIQIKRRIRIRVGYYTI